MIDHSKPYITKEDQSAVQQLLQIGQIAGDKKLKAFETELAGYVNASSAFATGSGTSALILALKALNIGANDEVILSTYVCRNVMDAVNNVGAIPVFCDIGSEWNMTSETIKTKISPKTKAIIVVHIFGIPADVKEIRNLGFPLVEDCCQSLGARSAGKNLGSESEMAMYSFHATKLLTTGEGGAVTTNDIQIAARIRELLDNNAIASPMTDLQAALGISQFKKFDKMLEIRKNIALKYCNNITAGKAKLPESLLDSSIFFRFPIVVRDLDYEKTHSEFLNRGIHVRHGVDSLLHRLQGKRDNEFPNALKAFDSTLSIPIYPALSEDEQEQIIIAANHILS